jgi:hypothetical protein
VLGLAALDEAANPSSDRDTAQRLVDVGAAVGAMTPGRLAAFVAERIGDEGWGVVRPELLALTPETLAELTNRGLVKRAARELEQVAPTVTEDQDGTVRASFPDGTESTGWRRGPRPGSGRPCCRSGGRRATGRRRAGPGAGRDDLTARRGRAGGALRSMAPPDRGAHQGLRHLPATMPGRLRAAAGRLNAVGLRRAAASVESLAARLGPDPGEAAIDAWVEAYLRITVASGLL